jgi:hypothetical protein
MLSTLQLPSYKLLGFRGLDIKDGLAERARLSKKIQMTRLCLSPDELKDMVVEEAKKKNETIVTLNAEKSELINLIGTQDRKEIQSKIDLIEMKISLAEFSQQLNDFKREHELAKAQNQDVTVLGSKIEHIENLITELSYRIISDKQYKVMLNYSTETNPELRKLQKDLRTIELTLIQDCFKYFNLEASIIDTTEPEELLSFLDAVQSQNLDPNFLA